MQKYTERYIKTVSYVIHSIFPKKFSYKKPRFIQANCVRTVTAFNGSNIREIYLLE